MQVPQLFAEEDPAYPDEVACMASFVPTMEPAQAPQEAITVAEDEKPDQTKLNDGSDFQFVFVVDRSASMGGQRMEITKTALDLFLQSLPVGCEFSILSFGSRMEFMTYKGCSSITYSDESMHYVQD